MLKGFVRKFRPLEILSEENIDAIHQSTLNILQNTGLKIYNKKALKLLEKNDCQVDFDSKIVKFPPALVEGCLRKSPSSFRVKARVDENDLMIGGDRLYFSLFAGMNTVDLKTWEPRTPTRKDLYDFMTVADALPNLHKLGCYPYFGFEGLPESMKIPESIAAKLRNTTKVQLQCFTKGSHNFTSRMMKIAGAEAIGVSHCASPLTYYKDSIDAMYSWIEAGFPVYICSGGVGGGSAPVTIAGNSVSNNAELMAGVIMAQLIKPGVRIIVADFTFPENMASGSPLFGDIAAALHVAAFSQLWRKYKIPTASSSTGLTSSKLIDYQCGYEKSIHTLVAALSGISIIDFQGGLSGELTAHPVQAILDDDVAGMIGRFIEGIQVDDETLAVDVLKEVGPIPGQFLTTAHTRKWWKGEQYTTQVADRLTYPEWMEGGKKSALDYAKERYKEIINTHKPLGLTEEQDTEIESILEELREYYRKQDSF